MSGDNRTAKYREGQVIFHPDSECMRTVTETPVLGMICVSCQLASLFLAPVAVHIRRNSKSISFA